MPRENSQPDIGRAIRRARRARASLRWRRRRLAAAAALSVLLAGAGTFSLAGLNGSDVVHAAVNHAQSLAEMLSQRSPGKRTQAQLAKHRKAPRALAKERHHLAPPVAQDRITPPEELARLLLAPPPDFPLELGTPAVLAQLQPPPTLADMINPPPGGSPPADFAPPPGGGSTVSPPGGSTPETFPTEQPREPITVPSAVPEPATWALMLMGFGFIGWRARRAKTAAPERLAA